MGKDARLRRLRREARQCESNATEADFAASYERQHPESRVVASEGREKMSEVLEEFAQPLLDLAESPEETERALLVAMIAWNYSLMNEAGGPTSEVLDSSLLADPHMRAGFQALVKRKQELFPDNKRYILDYQMIPRGKQFQFNVISAR